MRVVSLAVVVAAIGLSAPAAAKQSFAAYEGPDAEKVGQGGTKVSKDGIDFWTSGSPPRRFKVLGIMIDERKDRVFDGNVIGSGGVIKKTKEAGGDAVIVLGGSSEAAGFAGGTNGNVSGNGFNTFSHGRVINRNRTQLLVVKYLE